LIKGSKESDSSLVSHESLSEILPSSDWALGQVAWAKMAKNLTHLWRHSQKKTKPKIKEFLFRLAKAFEDLNSSLVQSAEELCHC